MKNCVVIKQDERPIDVLDVRVFSTTDLEEMKEVCIKNKEEYQQTLLLKEQQLNEALKNLQELIDKQAIEIQKLNAEISNLKGE